MHSTVRLLLAAGLLATIGPVASAATLRWSSASDIASWDIHAQNNALSNGIQSAVYEPLFQYNHEFQLEPALATGYRQLTPTQVRIALRRGVRFHDGSAFDADDVVFSIHRAMEKTSNFGVYTQGIDRVVRVDAATVDIHLKAPNPVLQRQLTELRIMDREWAEKHQALSPKDITAKEENHAHRHANGTGPYQLKHWAQGVKLQLTRHPGYWGPVVGNVDEIVYVPIASEPTRIAALLSGEIDLVLDPSPADATRLREDAAFKVVEGVENRTLMLGMDQHRDELPGSNVQGRNPLKDVRVRRALYQAIDIEAIQKSIMRGQSQPTGTMVGPRVNGWTPRVDARLPHDPAAARRLLAEAGYPGGFELDFACPNNRYINDEKLCQALVSMWARLGVKARLRTLPATQYFPMLQRHEASLYLIGWGVPTYDALNPLQALVHTVGPRGEGLYNGGRHSNSALDALIDQAAVEPLIGKRDALLERALWLAHETVAHIPLHNQVISWAMRKGVDVAFRSDNRIDMRRATVR